MEKAFTLIELLVSIVIFIIIITIVGDIFVSASKAQTMNLEANDLLSQGNYAMEYMSRAIRMAQKDVSGNCICSDCNYQTVGQGISFMNYEGKCQSFFLQNGQLMELKDGSTLPLTSKNVEIIYFNIAPQDSWSQGDSKQPRVTFALAMETKESFRSEKFKVQFQTTLSQRNLDISE